MKEFIRRISELSPKQLVLLAAELRSQLDKAERRATEPVAVIGMSCRFPGPADDPESFWEVLREGIDAVTEIPPDRWDVDAFFDHNRHAPGKTTSRWAGLLGSVRHFDAEFFGVAPREALKMDPQQRILLEVAWEALEHAGIAASSLFESQTGVFIGISGNDYGNLQLATGRSGIDAYFASGNAHSIASGRISYILGLRGPCLSVDTACSSSLVAAHLAVRSLRQCECDTALAGGVNLILSPEITIGLSKADMMAADGRCKVFDSRADGFVRGEGCGVVVLKRLSDALRDKDRILALIRGTAVNHDGKSNGLTAPSGPAQEAVIRQALADGNLRPEDIVYLEAHGTGTALGDPIEARALGAVLGAVRSPENPLWIGSVKANIGHLESAAGIAGLIKVILSLQAEVIPPQLHYRTLNPNIDWDHLPFRIPSHNIQWPDGKRRLAGVSSFGFSGTNAHVIVEEAPPAEAGKEADLPERPLHVLALSAKSPAALKALAESYARCPSLKERSLADVCFTANTGRSHFKHRVGLVADTPDRAQAELRAFAQEGASACISSLLRPSVGSEVAFLFTGQGSQYIGMAKGLYRTQPLFRTILDRCDAALQPLMGESVCDLVFGMDGKAADRQVRLNQTVNTQPALFAVEYALAQVWRSWGIEPSSVMGHSLGEYVAACVAGLFSLEDGLRLVARRAQLMQGIPARGAMAAILADPQQVEAALRPFEGRIAVAAYNGPSNTVVSGETDAIEALCGQFADRGTAFRKLQVSQAFHSALMEPMLAEFADALAAIDFKPPQIDVVSNVTGKTADWAMLSDPAYWVRHTRQPVRFTDSILNLHGRGYRIFLEVGPDPVLLGMAGRIAPSTDALWLPSLRKGQDDWRLMLQSLATLYANGFPVNWPAFDQPWPRRKVLLPTYPFERKAYWSGTLAAKETAPEGVGQENWRQWLYEFQWQEQPSSAGPADLASADEVTKRVLTDLEPLIREKDIAAYDPFLPRLDHLCRLYVLQAFAQLGWTFQLGARFDLAAMADKTGIRREHHQLLSRMLEILAEDDILRREGAEWCVVKAVDPMADPSRLLDELRSAYPGSRAELELIGNCGPQMAPVMLGQSDPMTVLFPNGSMQLLEDMYQSSRIQQFYNAMIQHVFENLVEPLPRTAKLRILEIGAGTGGTTRFILPAVTRLPVEYVYTDISEAFLHHAKRKFSALASLDFRLLDIAADPQSQGFRPQEFDIVIAANVLHATPDIRRTLANIHWLLAPGGSLVLLEGVERQRFSDLTVGLTKGWWHFTDTDLRPDYALLSEHQWRDQLLTGGFDHVHFMPGRAIAGSHPILGQQSVILAQCRPAEQRVEPRSNASGASWLIFSDTAGYGRRMAERLCAQGHSVALAQKGDAFARLADRRFQLRPSDSAHCAQLFEILAAEGVNAVSHIMYFWPIDETATQDQSLRDLEDGQQRMVASLLNLVQYLAGPAFTAPPPKLAIFTRSAQKVKPEDTLEGFAQGSLWGLGRVIAMEHPELQCVRVDLDGSPDTADMDAVIGELARLAVPESQLAFREGSRYALRLAASPAAQAPAVAVPDRFDAQGVYLITGGLAGLGLEVARWMVAQGAAHLALMGRSAPSSDSQAIIADMEKAGARIDVVQGDVADRRSLETLLTQLEAPGRRLRGVVHCAGTLDDGILLQQNWDRFRRTMQAKVLGTWNLHCLTREREMDFFVLFSSGAAFLGSSGQGNHAAANAFMDALAHYRKAAGQKALGINWGAWSRIGAAADEALAHRIQTKGLGLIAPSEGVAVLDHLLGGVESAQVAVLPIHWPEFLAVVGDKPDRALFDRFEMRSQPSHASAGVAAAPVFLDQLDRSAPGRRSQLIMDTLQQETRRCLGLDARQALDTRQPLTELGLDSLMAVELRNVISQTVQVPLPATLLFNYPSLEELVNHLVNDVLASRWSQGAPVTSEPEAHGNAGAMKDLDHFSEEEMENLLREKLMNI